MKRLWVILTLLLPVAPAAADWTAPTTVAQPPAPPSFFKDYRVAIDDSGAGTVVWGTSSPDATVSFVDVAADGTVGAAQPLSPAGVAARSPRLAMAGDGRAAVVWSVGPAAHSAGSGARVLQLVMREPGGAWSAPRTVVRRGRNVPGDVAFERDGTLALTWTRRSMYHPKAFVRRFDAAGDALSTIALAGRTRFPVLAVSAAFPRAVVAYVRDRGKDFRREAWARIGDRSLRLARIINGRPKVAAGDRVLVGWLTDGGGTPGSTMKVARLRAAGAPVTQTLGETEPFRQFAIAARGPRALAGWNAMAPDGHLDAQYAAANDGPFAPLADMTPGTAIGRTPAVALGDARSAAVYLTFPGPQLFPDFRPQLTAVVDGGQPVTLSRPDESPDGLQPHRIAMNAAGAAIVVYAAGEAYQDPSSFLGAKHLSVTALR